MKNLYDFKVNKKSKRNKVLKSLGTFALGSTVVIGLCFTWPYNLIKRAQVERREDSINIFLNDPNLSDKSKSELKKIILDEGLSINGEYTLTEDENYEKVSIERFK